jgi:hypothetical protein
VRRILLALHGKRLAFFDDVGCELGRVAAADVFHGMRGSVRDEQHFAGLDRHRRLAIELILKHAFDDIDELFARMAVLGGGRPRRKIDAHLDDLASRDAQIVLHEVGALEPRELRLRRLLCQSACDNQQYYRYDSNCFHVDLLRPQIDSC